MTRLVSERDSWREEFENGNKPTSLALIEYRKYRNSETWRVSSQVEQLCEYILYLEREVENGRV